MDLLVKNNRTVAKDIDSNEAQAEHLTINMQTSYEHCCRMSEEAKKRKQEGAPSLVELFEQSIADKGEANQAKSTWTSPETVEVEGLSNSTLNYFILQAEELGKKVTFNKTITVSISD